MKFKSALLITLLILVTYSCKKKEEASAEAPTFTTAVAFSSKTSSSMTISWAAADDVTAASDISYKVVYSLSNNITTVGDAEANGTLVLDWTINSLTTNMTSLTSSTTYYVSVLARDTDGFTEISAAYTDTLCSGKIMFLTAVTDGNLGGAAGADATCNANKPTGFSGSTFKAMLTDGTTRLACYMAPGNSNCGIIGTTGRLDWVFGNSQNVCTSDYVTKIGSTDANGLLTVTSANTLSSTATITYTGLNSAWGNSATNCSGFSTTAGTGIVGSANGTENGSSVHTFISSSIPACSTAGTIYCVEQ